MIRHDLVSFLKIDVAGASKISAPHAFQLYGRRAQVKNGKTAEAQSPARHGLAMSNEHATAIHLFTRSLFPA